jgi:disulfide bond formation protein DsbB
MTLPNKRLLNLAGLLACAGMMGFALYAQHVLLLEPCPLCVFQRIATISLGFVFLAATLHNPGQTGARVYGVLVGLVAACGVSIASWHVYLQNLPADEVPSCGPGFEYIMENFALFDALDMIFQGSGECAEVVWRLLGLSMPSWVIIGLGGLGIVGVYNNFRRA